MKNLFKETIDGWQSWANIFQSIEAFRDLIKVIFNKENIHYESDIKNLTPGTNAVFKVGHYVIKIYAPKESTFNTQIEYDNEINAIKIAYRIGINTPLLVANDEILDKYLFKYMIMEYIDGKEVGNLIKTYDLKQKEDFVRKLKKSVEKYHQVKTYDDINKWNMTYITHNNRWKKYQPHILNQIISIIEQTDVKIDTLIHGDLTQDNVIITPQNELYIIDYADSLVAPSVYEFPPLVCDLFDFDRILIKKYFRNWNYNEFIEQLYIGILLHDFGADFAELILKRFSNIESHNLEDIMDLKLLLYKNLR